MFFYLFGYTIALLGTGTEDFVPPGGRCVVRCPEGPDNAQGYKRELESTRGSLPNLLAPTYICSIRQRRIFNAVFSRPVTRTVGYGLVLVPNGFMAPTLQESTSQRSHMPHAQRATQTQRTSCPLNLGLQCHQLGVAAGADLFASKKHIM